MILQLHESMGLVTVTVVRSAYIDREVHTRRGFAGKMIGAIGVKGDGDALAWQNPYSVIERGRRAILWLALLIDADTEGLRHAVSGILQMQGLPIVQADRSAYKAGPCHAYIGMDQDTPERYGSDKCQKKKSYSPCERLA